MVGLATRPPAKARPTTPSANTTMPGPTERRSAFGAAGRPDSAATMDSLVTARAGRAAAKYVATTASAMAGPITTHGSANAGMS